MDFFSLAGGLIGGLATGGLDFWQQERNEDAQFEMARQQQEGQREFAQNALQWRVADARAAGLHPLSAISAQLPSYQPMVLGDTSPSYGQSIAHSRFGDSLSEVIREYDRDPLMRPSFQRKALATTIDRNEQIAEANLRLARSQADQSETQAAMQQIELNRMLFGMSTTNKEADALKKDPLFDIGPNQITASTPGKPWEGAGPGKPFWDVYHLDQGLQIDLPQGSNAGEAVEAISESKAIMAGVIAYNVKKYGPQWKAKFDRWWRAREESSRPPGGISDIPVF